MRAVIGAVKSYWEKGFPAARKRRKGGEDHGEAGWTVVELVIVIGIIMVLATTVGLGFVQYLDRAKTATAKNQIGILSQALYTYYMDCKTFPSQEQGLAALWQKPDTEPIPEGWNGPYLEKKIPSDPWGTPYVYTVPGENDQPFGIMSLGADKTEGGEGKNADITSWNDE